MFKTSNPRLQRTRLRVPLSRKPLGRFHVATARRALILYLPALSLYLPVADT